jgi:hypothetical protein
MSETFDRLVDASLDLTRSVERLVRLSWAIIAMNVILVVAIAAVVAWTLTVRQPARALFDVGDEHAAYAKGARNPSLVHAER